MAPAIFPDFHVLIFYYDGSTWFSWIYNRYDMHEMFIKMFHFTGFVRSFQVFGFLLWSLRNFMSSVQGTLV